MASTRIDVLKMGLNDSRAHLEHIIEQVGDRWETQVYDHGAAWNVRQLLVHLGTSESGMFNTAKAISEGGNPIPEDFDLERFNLRSTEKKADMTVAQARDVLTSTRADLMAWIGTLDSEKLARQGRHATLAVYTVEQFLRIIAYHERSHADDIARALNL